MSTAFALRELLREISINAKAAEDELWELSYQLKHRTEEAARLRANYVRRDADQVVDAPVDHAVEAMIATERKRLAELQNEHARDCEQKARLVKSVDRLMHGSGAPTLQESMHFASGRVASSALRLRSVLLTLPASNAELLSSGRYFDFAHAATSAAMHQLKRTGDCDAERAALAGVASTGQRISMNVVTQALAQNDFAKL